MIITRNLSSSLAGLLITRGLVGVAGDGGGGRAQLSCDHRGVNMSPPPSLSLSLSLLLLLNIITAAAVRLSQDGSYSGLTVSIEENVSEENCEVILQNIKVSPLSSQLKTVPMLTICYL